MKSLTRCSGVFIADYEQVNAGWDTSSDTK